MKAENIAVWIKRLTGVSVYTNQYQDNVYAPCPLAPFYHEGGTDESQGFSVKVCTTEQSVGYCWNASCPCTGLLLHIAKEWAELAGEDQHEIQEFTAKLEQVSLGDLIDEFSDFSLSFENEDMSKDPEYLEQFSVIPEDCSIRERVSNEAIEEWGLLLDSERNRVVIPVYSHDKILKGAQGRALGSGPKYYNYDRFQKGRYLLGAHVGHAGDVILVEGPFDAIKVREATGRHCVACMGSSPTKTQQKLLGEYQEVTIFPDNDAAGTSFVEKVVQGLYDSTSIRIVPYQGSALGDPGEMSHREINDFLDGSLPVRVK